MLFVVICICSGFQLYLNVILNHKLVLKSTRYNRVRIKKTGPFLQRVRIARNAERCTS